MSSQRQRKSARKTPPAAACPATRRRWGVRFPALLSGLLVLLWLSALPTAQTVLADELQTPAPAVESGVPVQLGGETVFRVRARLGTLSPSERASIVERRLVELAATPFLNLEDLRPVEYDDTVEIVLGSRVITVVTEADAVAAGLPRAELAQRTAGNIKAALQRVRQATSWQSLLTGVLFSLLATVVIAAVWRAVDELVARLRRAWRAESSTPHSSRLLNRLDVLVGGRLREARLTVLTGLWFLTRAGIVIAYLPLLFTFFSGHAGTVAVILGSRPDAARNAVGGVHPLHPQPAVHSDGGCPDLGGDQGRAPDCAGARTGCHRHRGL